MHYLPYCNNPPYVCFSFICWWYACCWSCFRCGTYFFMLTRKINSIRIFNLTNKMCNLISTWIGLVHITSIRFFTPNIGLCILGALMGFMPFMKSFVAKALLKDLNTIINFHMLADPHATFTIFLLCYGQHPKYFLQTIFFSLVSCNITLSLICIPRCKRDNTSCTYLLLGLLLVKLFSKIF